MVEVRECRLQHDCQWISKAASGLVRLPQLYMAVLQEASRFAACAAALMAARKGKDMGDRSVCRHEILGCPNVP